MGLAELGIEPDHHGKVREILDLGRELLIVTTDRISAFDYVLPTGIPRKGVVLNRIATYWFRGLTEHVPTHWLAGAAGDLPERLQRHAERLQGRVMRVHKARRLPVECIVRGWITGSGYASYQKTGEICGVELPAGLAEFDRLPEPIFTPTTKADQGHDEPITFEQLAGEVGRERAEELRRLSLQIYGWGAAHAQQRGIIIADAKFEFGLLGDRLAVIDELLTPDSSRFWPAESVGPGRRPVSLDKQFVRDYLLRSKWDRQSTPPELPEEIVRRTRERYEVVERLLIGGRQLPRWPSPPGEPSHGEGQR
ncbi:MAG: phosphoribosylaminoimidazolesuccinocarboxamide synthase [Candidatus Eisenbacteria bacterium]|nr:phosphoribosylaminoimidazolesuccinocarboxamide synthase [Candidatus Eisenbacteria bacterium]